jgi:uncharacterized protein Smg (DUF494 family)
MKYRNAMLLISVCFAIRLYYIKEEHFRINASIMGLLLFVIIFIDDMIGTEW